MNKIETYNHSLQGIARNYRAPLEFRRYVANGKREMAFTLDKIVPWGRSFDEYVAMFALSEEDIGKRFLGCGDGPANFNCVLTRRGGRVISADPIYHFSASEIRNRINETYEEVMEQTRKNKDEFIWKHFSSVEELGRVRMAAMEDFLSDYPTGLMEGRYVDAALPILPFKNREFDIALCSHFLFLYSEHLSVDFHVQSIEELCRVASEARIFPLLELGTKKSRHLEAVITRLKKGSLEVNVEKVPYEFQKGGNQMLKVKATYQITPADAVRAAADCVLCLNNIY